MRLVLKTVWLFQTMPAPSVFSNQPASPVVGFVHAASTSPSPSKSPGRTSRPVISVLSMGTRVQLRPVPSLLSHSAMTLELAPPP